MLHHNDNELSTMLDSDPILQENKTKALDLISQLSVTLASTINRLIEILPTEEKKQAQPILMVDTLVEGIRNEICIQTMDNINPNWQLQVDDMISNLSIESILDILSSIKPPSNSNIH